MGQHLTFPGIYLTDAQTGRRCAVHDFAPGDALVSQAPILGYCYQQGHLTVYVSGTMPLAMRTAAEDGCTDRETWLVDVLPAGIQEITLPDHRHEFALKKAA